MQLSIRDGIHDIIQKEYIGLWQRRSHAVVPDVLDRSTLSLQLRVLLIKSGPLFSRDLQSATGKSQPTISRALAEIGEELVRIGPPRAIRYAIQASINGRPGTQPLYWIDENGQAPLAGQVTLTEGGQLITQVDGHTTVTDGCLPWFLSPLQLEGFLGRLHAKRIADETWDTDPERWTLEQTLFASLLLHDAPGAIILGNMSRRSELPTLPNLGDPGIAGALDLCASEILRDIPAGSSAGGEQPKFLATTEGVPVLAKFSPPNDTPFDNRWSDLLQAEALANTVLRDYGIAAANSHVVISNKRTYLISERFDRTGGNNADGRRHVVSIGAAHKGLLRASYSNWADSAQALVRIRRLAEADAKTADTLLRFGRLIGNSDMHSGNLAFFLEREALAKGVLTLAPVYDMLPMRWRPNPQAREFSDYTSFDVDERNLGTQAHEIAADYWGRLADVESVSTRLREVASDMHAKLIPRPTRGERHTTRDLRPQECAHAGRTKAKK